MSKTLISAKNVHIRYGQSDVVRDVSFNVFQGDYIGLAGPNGAGKSTLIKAILGLNPLAKGSLMIFDTPVQHFTHFEKIGYLPQKHTSINTLFPASVKEVIAFGLLARKKTPRTLTSHDWEKVSDILTKINIVDLKNRMLTELSGGQQQKVLLARALVSKPELLILDEPSTALDPDARDDFFALIKKLNTDTNMTIILITHDTGYIGTHANKLLYIDRSMIFFGPIHEFCSQEDRSVCFEKIGQHIIWHQHT